MPLGGQQNSGVDRWRDAGAKIPSSRVVIAAHLGFGNPLGRPCPLSGVKRTLRFAGPMAANDPKRTRACAFGLDVTKDIGLYVRRHLDAHNRDLKEFLSEVVFRGASMKIRIRLLGIAVSVFAASLLGLFQATAVAQPYSSTYPTPYQGPFTVTTAYSYSLDNTSTFTFTVPSANIQNGELLSTFINVTSNATGSYGGYLSPSVRSAFADAPMQLTMPGLLGVVDINQLKETATDVAVRPPGSDPSTTYTFNIPINSSDGLGPVSFQKSITTTSQIPSNGPQVMPNASSYSPALGGGTGTLTIGPVVTRDTPLCCVTSLSVQGNFTVSVNQTFRPWTTGDILTGQIAPASPQSRSFQVNVTPNFGFTAQQAAAAGLGGANSTPFQSFNYVQTITGFGCYANSDCGAGSAFYAAGTPIPTTLSPPGTMIGSIDSNISTSNNGLNLFDQPDFASSGLWMAFRTSLFGVYADGSTVNLTDAFNDPEFTLNWIWAQGTPGEAITNGSGVFDPTDIGTAFFLGYGDISTDTLNSFIDVDLSSLTSQTPLPATLPLFATGFAGLGLLGWRRKRKAQPVA
jgi:hypothetical protein